MMKEERTSMGLRGGNAIVMNMAGEPQLQVDCGCDMFG